MSSTIDNRIVKMQFNNSQFESGVKTSMNTIEKLKESLNFDSSAKSFENLGEAANGISFDSLLSSVKSLEERFSAFGIVGMRIIENLTDSIMNLASQTVSFLTNSVVNGGITRAMNLENAHFMLQGLLGDEEAVQAVMQNVNDAVDGTAYSLDAAATVASQLVASGMEAGDEMYSALRAVAGVAAMTNSEYSDIGQIFTTVAGNGRLMGDQLLQLSSRGLNAAATLADYLGTTESAVREMVSAGEIDFQTFADAMDSAFGEHAKAANETFTGALSNIKSALARIGALFVSPLIEQNGVLVTLFNTVRERINDVKANVGDLADSFVDAVSTTATSLNTYFSNLDLTKPFEVFYNVVESISNTLKGIKSVIKPVSEAFKEVFPGPTIDDAVSFSEALKTLTERLTLSDEASQKLKNAFTGIFKVISRGIDYVKTFGDAFKNVVTTIQNVFKGLGEVAKAVAEELWMGFSDLLIENAGSFRDAITSFSETISKLSSRLTLSNEASEKLHNTFKGVFAVIDIGITAFKELVKGVVNLVTHFDGLHISLLDITGSLGDFLSSVRDSVKESGVFETVVSKITNAIGSAIEKIKEFASSIKDIFESSGISGFSSVLTSLWNVVKMIANGIGELFSNIGNSSFSTILSGGVLATLAYNLKSLIYSIRNVFGVGTSGKGGLLTSVTTTLNQLRSTLTSYQTNLKADSLIKLGEAIALLALSMVMLSTLDSEALATSISAIGFLLGELVVAMSALQKMSGATSENWTGALGNFINSYANTKMYSGLIMMAGAIAILAGALTILSKADQNNLQSSLLVITGLFADLTVSMILLNKLGGKTSGLTTMLGIATAVYILSSALKSMAALSWGEIAKGLVSVTVLCAELVVAMIALSKFGGSTKGIVAMIALAEAVKILGSACEIFAAMSWSGIAKGLTSVGALLLELAAFSLLTGNSKNLVSTGLGMIELAAAMKIFASVMEDFAGFSWMEIAKGLTAMGGALAEVTVAANLMPKNMVSKATGMVVMGAALEIIVNVMQKMAGMSIVEIAQSLITMGLALTEFAVALNFMSGTLSGAAALLVAAVSINVLVPALKALGSMSIASIAKALITLAAAFTVVGVAAAVLSPLTASILALAAAMALIGVSVAAVGLGLVAAGAGISAIAVGLIALSNSLAVSLNAIVIGLETILISIISLIPNLAVALGEAIVMVVEFLAENAPTVADSLLKMLLSILDSLVEYTPQIVESLMQLIIGVIEAIANNIPELVVAVMDLIGSLFKAIIEAINGLDSSALLEGIVCVGLLSALVVALSAIAGLVPAAMVALAELGLLVAEMSVIFAAIGALAQIPGLTWLVEEGAELLQGIGTAIGSFVGGIVGGFMEGVSSQFPQIGSDLSGFMINAQPFIEGASKIDSSVLAGVAALAGTILALTAADVITGLTSWFTGGSSIVDFGKELAEFGPSFNEYYEAVKDIDGGVVQASANAACALAEMANNLPNSGGVVGWFAGENDLSTFAEELAEFGPSLKAYADSVDGLDGDVVVNSANAACAIAEMANNLPNSGGALSVFVGDNTLSDFAKELVEFGPSLKEYADSVDGLDGDVVVNSANAACALAEMANNLPNSGGAISVFAGDNTLSDFGAQLAKFGPSMAVYAKAVKDLDSDAVVGSASAAAALSEMASGLPNSGGAISLFAGDNTLSDFGAQLAKFGPGLKKYADSIKGMNSGVVTDSANAASALAEMSQKLPNSGGAISLFSGDNTLSDFGEQLAKFGPKLKEYADSVKGINTLIVKNSANAGEILIDMAKCLPNSGGITEWITGESSLSKFGEELAAFGPNLKKYSVSVAGIKSAIVAISANAAKTLFEMAENLPNQGGILSWFTGDNTLSAFGEELAAFGPKLKEYSLSVEGLKSSVVTISANAAKVLFKMAENLPDQGGILSWFTGDNTLSAFGAELVIFGPQLKEYAESVDGLKATVVTISAIAGNTLFEMAKNLPEQGGMVSWFTGDNTLSAFGAELVVFGPQLKSYSDSVEGIKGIVVSVSANAAKVLFEMAENLPDQGGSGILSWFTGENTLSAFGEELVVFGPQLKSYADSVEGIKGIVVSVSANAAKVLFEMAENLPDQGGSGILSWFTGENTLSAFGEELVAFGPNLKKYSDSVEGIKGIVVSVSANAAKVLFEMAKNLPEQGGILSWFFGDNTLSDFGEELVEFGPKLKEYAESVDGLDGDVVTNSANAAKSLAELSKNLPESGGIFSWFFGDNDLATFGESLVSFGESFASYYESVKDIKTNKLSVVTEEFQKLVEMAADIEDIDTSEMKNFSKALTTLGNNGVDGFIGAFDDANARVTQAASDMLDCFIDGAEAKEDDTKSTFTDLVKNILKALEKKESEFKTCAKDSMSKFISGVESKETDATVAFSSIVSTCLTKIKDKYSNFNTKGKECMSKFISGVTSKKTTAKNNVGDVVSSCVTKVRDYYTNFYNAGAYLVGGFSDGIDDNAYKAAAKAKEMAKAAADAAAKELDEHSPSKVGYQIGDYFGIAFVNAIGDSVSDARDTAAEMANSAKEGLTDALSGIASIIDGDLDLEPTIKPVLDLSDVTNGANTLNALFSRTQAMSVDAAMNRQKEAEFQNGENLLNLMGNNDDVVDAIGTLRGDVETLANVIANLKVVMDTGALVGTLASPMNAALGKQAIYEGRGI